jgi:hypothetical protein
MSSCTDEPFNNFNENAFISEVFDYKYAPGQYVGSVGLTNPQNFTGIPSYLNMTSAPSKSAVSLGGWGGYIVAGFNHNIVNVSGNDFIVFCGSSPSPEPAVVYVMADDNNNGLPDDTWYELKGSEIDHSDTDRNYSVTYNKPNSENDNITWQDNKANQGVLINGFATASTYNWWKYPEETSLTFTGIRLPNAYYNNSNNATQNWVLVADLFTWGYAENAESSDYNATYKGNEFDISNAIDASGNSVSLTAIRFIKIQTGVFQQAGWLNEISTEVYGAADLSLLKK